MHALSHVCVRHYGRDRVVRGDHDPYIQHRVVVASDKASDFGAAVTGANGDTNGDNATSENGCGYECTPGPFTHLKVPP